MDVQRPGAVEAADVESGNLRISAAGRGGEDSLELQGLRTGHEAEMWRPSAVPVGERRWEPERSTREKIEVQMFSRSEPAILGPEAGIAGEIRRGRVAFAEHK